MIGPAVDSVHAGLRTMVEALRKNPYALEIGAISIITFDRKAIQLVPLTEVCTFQMPDLDVAPGTALGAGLCLLDGCMTKELIKSTPEQKGDYKPLVFILTDGQPTDDWKSAATQFRRNHKSAMVYAVGCGDDVDFSILRELTGNTFSLTEMTPDAFAKLFVCISTSIQTASAKVGEAKGGGDVPDLEKLAPATVKKVTDAELRRPSSGKKRQVFLHCVCQKQKKSYLARYKLDENGKSYIPVSAHPLRIAFSKEERNNDVISNSMLNGHPGCPYCGNLIAGYCRCGTMLCMNPRLLTKVTCPVCGSIDDYGYGTFDIGQSAG
jgi:uncharacterized protein YegL